MFSGCVLTTLASRIDAAIGSMSAPADEGSVKLRRILALEADDASDLPLVVNLLLRTDVIVLLSSRNKHRSVL